MTERRRSPFGELVYTYRTSLNLTQADLATRASEPRPGHDRGTVSERTVQNIEQEYRLDEKWLVPRMATVAALADVFGLPPESERWQAFVTASRAHATEQGPELPVTPVRSRPASRQNARPPGRAQPDFVPAGREPQLKRLQHGIERVAQGESGVMFVAAEPGTGKTALIAHACHQGVADHEDLVVLWGECASLGSAADPHQPFRQALGLMVGDTGTASPTHVVSDLNVDRLRRRVPVAFAAVVDHGPSLGDRFIAADSLRSQIEQGALADDLAAGVGTMLDAPNIHPGAQGLNEQVFRTLTAYAASGPVVLVIEDVHWADVGTAALIFHLVRRLHEQDIALLLIGSYRMSDLNQGSAQAPSPIASAIRESLRYFPDVVVDLSEAVGGTEGEAFVRTIVERTVDGAPPDLAPALFRQTGGLPLFVVALLDWYQTERNTLATGNDALARRLQSANLPVRLEGALSFLIDRMPSNLQSLIAIASVQGPTFSADILQRVAGLTPAELMAAVDQNLYRRYQLVRPAGLSTTAGVRSHDYQFDHALLRDVLYQRLTELERTHYHATTAAAMANAWGEGNHAGSARIAWHHAQAGNHRAEAVFSLYAGNHSLEMQEYNRARDMFNRIREIGVGTASPALVAQSLVGLGNSARGSGQMGVARDRLNDAIDLARRHGLPLVHANALTSMAMLDFDAGKMAAGANRLEQAVNSLEEHGDLVEACRSLYLLSHTLQGMGRYDDADRRARQAIRLAEEIGDDMLLVGGTIALANTRLELGWLEEAIDLYRTCLPLCETHHNVRRAAVCWLNIALASIDCGDVNAARAALDPVFGMRGHIPDRLIAAALFDLALCSEGDGHLDAAQDHYLASLDLRERVGQHALAIDSLAGLARVAIGRQDVEAARRTLREIDVRVARQGSEGIEHLGRLWITQFRGGMLLGDETRIQAAVQHAISTLQERAAMLADPVDRRSYLHHVLSHRVMIEHAREYGFLDAHDPLWDRTV